MSEVSITAEEALESLTGFDEIAIAQRFDDIGALVERGGSMFARALVFVLKRRDGLDDMAAHAAAMALPLRELNAFFVAEPEEGEAGKDAEPPSEPQPEGSPASA